MGAFLSALMKEGVISIVVLILLCLLVFFGGYYYLEMDQGTIFLIIAILIAIWAIVFIIQKVLAVRNAVRIEKQLKAQGGSELEGADADKKAEIKALRDKFDESLDALKKTKGGKSALFTLPWYVIIGPPGSGKTTALQESGLNFPAAQGGAKVRGIGGTRNCDWWFTSDGILLDTAGRYTTVAEDQEEWFAFLEMIKTSRKDKPINGAIVAIAVDDLFRSTEAELFQMAKDVRNRLDELAARLQAVFPVYMTFTKCDLISGFVEFFEDFNKEQRGQVWGFSFPYSLPDRQYTEIFSDEVAKLKKNIKARQLDLLSSERPPQKKQSIYLFPHQLELAAGKMKEFLAALFGANAFQESAMLRGIYFTSGTQKGTPIDQVLSRMSEAMGFEGEAAGSEERIEKKSYFIHNLFTRIIFRDKTLARSNRAVLRKRRAARLTIQLLSLLALAVMSWALIGSFVGNHDIVSDVEAAGIAVNGIDEKAKQVEKLRTMDGLRQELIDLHNMDTEGRPVSLSYGMYQGDTMFNAGARVYFQRLRPTWILKCHERVEDELNQLERSVGATSSQEEYQRLLDLWRVYRMMGGDLKAEVSMVQTILKRENRWTGPLGNESQEIEALAGEQLEFYALMLQYATPDADPYKLLVKADPTLVRRISEILTNAYWEVAAYDSIIQRTYDSVGDLTIEDIVPDGEQYLELRVDARNAGFLGKIGAFTQNAWDNHVKSLIEERAQSLAKLYTELEMEKGARNPEEWRRRLTERHKTNHTQVWNDFLNATHPDPETFETVDSTRNALEDLVKDNSAYRKLIEGVWNYRKITLAPNNRVPGPTKEERESLDKSFEALTAFQVAFENFAKNTDENQRVVTHLEKPERLGALEKAFDEAGTKVPAPFTAKNTTAGAALKRIVDSSFEALRSEGTEEIEDRWKEKVYTPWTKEFAGKFPFDTSARENVSMVSFSNMFNPVDGSLKKMHQLVAAVEDLRFDGKMIISRSAKYRDTIAAAEKVRAAMFHADNDERVSVKFSLQLEQVGAMVSSTVQIGTDDNGNPQTLTWNDNPQQTREFHWAQYPDRTWKMGARVEAYYTRNKIRLPVKNLLDDQWGALKVFWRETHVFRKEEGENKYHVEWLFRSPDGQMWVLYAYVTPQKAINPFDRAIFKDMKMSEKVSK